MVGFERGSGPGAMKIGPHPWVIHRQHLLHRTRNEHLALGQNGDPVTDRMQGIEVMCNQKDC